MSGALEAGLVERSEGRMREGGGSESSLFVLALMPMVPSCLPVRLCRERIFLGTLQPCGLEQSLLLGTGAQEILAE